MLRHLVLTENPRVHLLEVILCFEVAIPKFDCGEFGLPSSHLSP